MERDRVRRMRGFVIALVAGLVLASAGVAGARQGDFAKASQALKLASEQPVPSSECAPSEEPDPASSDIDEPSEEADEGVEEPDPTSDEGVEEPDLISEGDGGEAEEEECPSPDDETDGDDEESDVPEVSSGGDRQAECEEAAGLSTDDEPEVSEDRSKGLDHAIEVVLANCIKNPQSHGLVNALRHLAANREKHLARDEAKAERKAAKAAGDHGKGHGRDKPKKHSP